MKLCGHIAVELEVDDFVQAADHQKRLEDILERVRYAYPEATLTIRERRQRKVVPSEVAPETPGGGLNRYEDR